MTERDAGGTHPLVREAREDDLPALLDLTIAAFGERVRERMRVQLYEDAGHLLHQSRLVEVDGIVAGYVRVSPRPIYYGTAVLPMGGIGAVCAHPLYRGRGFPSAILADCLTYMREQSYLLTILFTGIQSFYARLGWVPFPESVCTVPLPDCQPNAFASLDAPGNATARPYEHRDLEAVAAIYAAYNARGSGMAVRDAAAWRDGHRRFLGIVPLLVVERAGDVVAYASAQPRDGGLHVYEAGCLPGHEAAFLGLAAGLLSAARQAGGGAIRLSLGHTHGLSAAVRAATGTTAETLVSRHMMVRLLDLPGLVQAALPAFEHRLATQPWLAGLRAAFELEVAGQTASLAVVDGRPVLGARGEKRRLALPEELFWRIFFGASTVPALREELSTLHGLHLDPQEEALLGALFPLQNMTYARPDHF